MTTNKLKLIPKKLVFQIVDIVCWLIWINIWIYLGPGEHGVAFYLSPEDEKIKDKLYKVNGFNALVSDRISVNRTVKDIRHQEWVHF